MKSFPAEVQSEVPSPAAPSPAGWNLHILSPEESERLLRDEPRRSADDVLAELERKYGAERRDA